MLVIFIFVLIIEESILMVLKILMKYIWEFNLINICVKFGGLL